MVNSEVSGRRRAINPQGYGIQSATQAGWRVGCGGRQRVACRLEGDRPRARPAAPARPPRHLSLVGAQCDAEGGVVDEVTVRGARRAVAASRSAPRVVADAQRVHLPDGRALVPGAEVTALAVDGGGRWVAVGTIDGARFGVSLAALVPVERLQRLNR